MNKKNMMPIFVIWASFSFLIINLPVVKSVEFNQDNPLMFTSPYVQWNETYNKYGGVDTGYVVQQTSDGGYFIVANAMNPSTDDSYVWLIKTNANGGIVWQFPYGGESNEYKVDGSKTTDGGYVLCSTHYNGIIYQDDAWVQKVSSSGSSLWSYYYNCYKKDTAASIMQTSDGGYIITGTSTSTIPAISKCFLMKITSSGGSGGSQWPKFFEEGSILMGQCVRQISGGYIILALTGSAVKGETLLDTDVVLIKTDSNGNQVWRKYLGYDSYGDFGNSIRQTSDGGYVIIGFTDYNTHGMKDIWLVKTDSAGNQVWDQKFGGIKMDMGFSVEQTSDGGYILTGFQTPSTGTYGDLVVIKTTSAGVLEWQVTLGGSMGDQGQSICQTNDGFIVVGASGSYSSSTDVWLIKLKNNQAPNTPSNPSPVNHATGVNVNAGFSWTGGDPDSGDTVTYDVYFGTTNPPPKVVGNQSGITYDPPGSMNPNTHYYWRINAWDNHGAKTNGFIWDFTTQNNNNPPVFGTPSPVNGSTGNLLSLTWSIPINDPEGNLFSWSIQCSNGQINSGTGATNGTKTLALSGLTSLKTYKVWVNATDPTGSGLYTRRWYTFTTKANLPPVFGTPTPTNGSTSQPFSLTWSIPINDPEGNAFTWSIQCSNGQTNSGTAATNGTKTLALSGLTSLKTYKVWVNATDPTGSGLYTRKWYTFTTQQQPNVPPNKPNKPSGTASGKIKTDYTYTTSTTDPNGDQVYYLWDWGDGTQSNWLGPYNSGVTISTTHTWTVKGSYSIKVKAKDTSAAESNWSDPLPIKMPYAPNNPMLQFLDMLFQRFPHAFPILRHLMGY